jgi:hypothetical protein
MMTETKTFIVKRAMHGDGKDYARDDTREMTEIDAAPLLRSGALARPGEEPATRKPAVQHTFGTRPSVVNDGGYTTAIGDGIITPDAPAPAAPAASRRKGAQG